MKTERLEIRRIKAEDWKAIQEIWKDESLSPYAQFDNIKEIDDQSVENRIARWATEADRDEHIFLAVCLNYTVIGFISANMIKNESYEIGYCFHSDYHGKGYAKESLSAAFNYLKERGAKHLMAGTALENTPSIRLLKALGFIQTGTEKVSFYKDSEGNDIVFEGGIFELEL